MNEQNVTQKYFETFRESWKECRISLSECMQICSVQATLTEKLTKEKLMYVHLYHDLKETHSWLILIWDAQLANHKLKPALIAEDVLTHSENYMSFIEDMNDNTERTRLYMKACYTWLDHVLDDIRFSSTLNNSKYKLIKGELEQLCLFRHHMIKHKKDIESYPLNYIFPWGDPEEFRLLMVPYGFRSEVWKEFDALIDECITYLTGEETKKQSGNSSALSGIVYLEQNSSKLPRTLKKKVRAFLEKHGTCSETPLVLMQFVAKLAKEVLLPYAHSLKNIEDC